MLPEGTGSSIAMVTEDSRDLNLGSASHAHRAGTAYKKGEWGMN